VKRLLLVAASLAVIVLAYQFSPPFRIRTLTLIGASPDCPLERALEAPQELKERVAAKDRLLAASKEVEKDGGLRSYQTPQGLFWIPYREPASLYALAWNLAEMDRRFYGNFLQKGDVVLDCGANVGVFTRLALNDGAGKVVAIEPVPSNIESLRRTFKAEIEQGRVVVYPKGVWDKDDFLEMMEDPGNSAADSFVIEQKGAKKTGLKLPLTTIDKMVAELGLDEVHFIKMDIEGAEENALHGAKETIAKHKPRMALSTYHRPQDPKALPAAVAAARPGYQVTCGPCAETGSGVRPDVMYFQ
jgi:FkbM family methyltransferase